MKSNKNYKCNMLAIHNINLGCGSSSILCGSGYRVLKMNADPDLFLYPGLDLLEY